MVMKTYSSSLFLLIVLLLPACQPTAKSQVRGAERLWQEQNITSYEIEVQHVQSIWHAQTNRIVVRDGVVVATEATCVPAPAELGSCEVEEVEGESFTVDALFAHAYSLADRDEPEAISLSFDPHYGYPTRLHYDHPDILDEDVVWAVTHFAALP